MNWYLVKRKMPPPCERRPAGILGKMPGLTARLVPGMHTEPLAMAVAAPLVRRKRWGYPN